MSYGLSPLENPSLGLVTKSTGGVGPIDARGGSALTTVLLGSPPLSSPLWYWDRLREVDTQAFLDALLLRAVPEHFIEFRLVAGDRTGLLGRLFVRLADLKTSVSYLPLLERNLRETSALLFGPNARAGVGGRDQDVAAVVSITVDVDADGTSDSWARLLALARSVPPFGVVGSGQQFHGHVYFRLKNAETRFDLVQSVVRRLQGYLGADHTGALSHCWRLPGSLNWKAGSPVRTAAWIDAAAETRLEEIDACLTMLGFPHVDGDLRSARTEGPPPSANGADLDVEAILGRLSSYWVDLIRNGYRPGGPYPSQSEADMAVVGVLVDTSATDAEIQAIFSRFAIGAKYRREGWRYLSLTINTARGTHPQTLVRVERVNPAPPNGRLVLNLLILDGPYEGKRFDHGVTSTSVVWNHLFKAAGMEPPPLGQTARALALLGSDLRVRLESVFFNGAYRLQVSRFLPLVHGRGVMNRP